MTTKQLRTWARDNGQPDQWWLCVDDVVEADPLSCDQIDLLLESIEYAKARVAHISEQDSNSPAWIDLLRPMLPKANLITPPTKINNKDSTDSVSSTMKQEAKVSHLFGLLGAVVCFMFILNLCTKEPSKRTTKTAITDTTVQEWYVGGTLSSGRATMSQWNKASYENRLASSADFVARSIGGQLGSYSMDSDIKPMAIRLEQEISAAYQPGVTDSMQVADIAASIVVVLKSRGQWLR